ncbi:MULTISPECIES: ABC transporter permease [unclassified Arthrobacter]|uniref:ABC transporter permease n=1 Tax=unclassified Arthrobacter TaxID=235627 RepID=UPI00159E0C07|nr:MULTISPECIES: ABC transporter permease [unclassified Arthrobacter]MCQ9162888.1 ABC transporter permease [Arthrobacter sp. STN4]NVN00724.1 ABC transporter permease [Arthrobacter sp. SDTb3-6]
MVSFILKRIASGISVLVAISFFTYCLLYFSSANIARNILGEYASQAQVQAKEIELGLHRPLLSRFFEWAGNAVQGDFGASWFTSEPVVSAITTRLPVTLTLVIVSIVCIAIIATLLGTAAAVKRGWIDRLVQGAAVVGDAIPDFVLAIVLVAVFAINLKIFPATSSISPDAGSAAWVASMTLPVIALLINGIASIAQQIRSAVIKQLEKDYVRTLRSRGIPEWEILFKHVLRSAAPAGLTVLSLKFVGMLGGVVIIEQIFALPGMGALAVQSTSQGDIPLVMGVVLYTVIIVIIVNLLVDLINGWLNPKVRVS